MIYTKEENAYELFFAKLRNLGVNKVNKLMLPSYKRPETQHQYSFNTLHNHHLLSRYLFRISKVYNRCAAKLAKVVHIVLNFVGEWTSVIHGGRHWYPLFWLLVTFALDFKSRVDPFTWVLCCLISMDSSDSPPVQDLLISWWSARQPSPFYPLTFQSLVEANRCCASKAGAILESLLTKVQKRTGLYLPLV